MKINKKIVALLLIVVFTTMNFIGCGKTKQSSGEPTSSNGSSSSETKQEIKTFTAFMAVPGTELPADNRVMNKIAEKIGVKAEITWLTGQTAAEKIGVMVAGSDYPDFVCGSEGTKALIEAGAYIPLDEYFDDYPNIKNFLSESEWNRVRSEDGHIYIIPQFGIIQGEDTSTKHSDEAFWIQKRVLEWANYPAIKTLDQYLDIIGRYLEANPTTDGQNNIGFEILCDDWRYFCLENPPQFLAGYPNDGCAIVDPVTKKVSVYDKIPEAKEYFGIINEQYNKGIIDPETFTLSYDQYIAKISSGRVLGMVDQYWNFQNAEESLVSQGLDDRTYVPLGIVLDENTVDKYFNPSTLDVSNGIGITVNCKDVEGALKFMNDLLDPEILALRFWGEEGIDYEVDENGLFYRTQEQRDNGTNVDYANNNLCQYSYFPHFEGMQADGINTMLPADQPSEFYDTLTEIDKKILDAYGFERWTDFLTPVEENSPWFPLWSATNQWTADTPYGIAKQKMADIKHEYLPKVIMSPPGKFEDNWNEYMAIYESEIDYKAYEEELEKEVEKRIATSKGAK